MSEVKHTPLPWEIVRSCKMPTINGRDGRCIASTGSAYFRGVPECDANAALIIHSVNTLPALVQALEEAKAALENNRRDLNYLKPKRGPQIPFFESEVEHIEKVIASITAALAASGGGK